MTRLPKRLRRALRRSSYALLDAWDVITRRRDPLVPPRSLLSISTDPRNDYRTSGTSVVGFLVEHCALRPDHAVLDVGCGVGRIAFALGSFLSVRGRYEGFDIVADEIAWCTRHLGSTFPNFRFLHVDVFNRHYNASGRTAAANLTFPYSSDTFDCVVVASVFTHMLGADFERYLKEIARVLKPGGRCLASFYLLNRAATSRIGEGRSAFRFAHTFAGAAVEDPDSPELAVAHTEDRCRALIAEAGLAIDRIIYGKWSSSRDQSQDLVVLQLPDPNLRPPVPSL